MKHINSTLVILAAAGVLLGACAKEPDVPRLGADESQPGQAPDGTKPADRNAAVAPTLAAYEDIRAKLAADDISGAAAQASALETAATTSASAAPEALRDQLSNTAQAARVFGKTPADDPDAVRKAFGEVSRSVVALLAADPSLQRGAYVFECPMAQGYQKWVQRTEAIENPYMGQRMLGCGSAIDWDS